MTVATKIDFNHRRIRQIADVTDLVGMLFPGNRNQQHAAARILLALKASRDLVPSLSFLEKEHEISRRTLQRTRAKLSRLGLIEHVTWMSNRHGGKTGWRLFARFAGALRVLAEKAEAWAKDEKPERARKEEALVGLLGP